MSDTPLNPYAVLPLGPAFVEAATALAAEINCPLLREGDDPEQFEVLLQVGVHGLGLQATGKKAPGAINADFLAGATAHRRKFGGGKGQMIAKAVGIKGGIRPQVLDVTAGLGKDAFVLATLGCEMTLVERSPVIHALLRDGIERAKQDPEVAEIVERMQLNHANSIDWMREHAANGERYQVVYVDPMFPHNDKSALVKKEMRVFRPVVGDDTDAEELLEAALGIAENRVVVKRPRKAPTIGSRAPSYQLEGKSSRYDIYTLKKLG
ncbi:class I SAM-dependent methyltransferase [Pontibacterium granulatum]|uniref:class I SAM-dependent methyltransferase n=1 Tax=Pontibacterium granulatum TaxID=2036029 RepID=UPI00249B0198|nr:class I SAM-dependent methyltransferase [Pontibacterium granulatum]MDI3323175.1 class I SAM-dependent methyltransferase [Pontibacterium granulatum]